MSSVSTRRQETADEPEHPAAASGSVQPPRKKRGLGAWPAGIGATGRTYEREIAWIKENGSRYPNQWLAVLGDDLVIADPDGAVVIRYLQERPEYHDAIVYFEP